MKWSPFSALHIRYGRTRRRPPVACQWPGGLPRCGGPGPYGLQFLNDLSDGPRHNRRDRRPLQRVEQLQVQSLELSVHRWRSPYWCRTFTAVPFIEGHSFIESVFHCHPRASHVSDVNPAIMNIEMPVRRVDEVFRVFRLGESSVPRSASPPPP